MKTTCFITSLILALALFSCTNRVELNNSSNKDKKVSVSFSATISNYALSPTRTMGLEPSDLQKNLGRFNIDGIRIVLYKHDTNGNPTEVAYVFQNDARYSKGVSKGTETIEIDKEKMSIRILGNYEITMDDYTVLFFATPSESLKKATEVGQSYSMLDNVFTFDYHVLGDGVSNLNFNVYSNIENPLVIKEEDLSSNTSSSVPYTITSPILSPVNAMVYVNFSKTLSADGLEYNPALPINVFLDAQNRKYYLRPNKIKSTFDDSSAFEIPQDPNYSGMLTKSTEELNNEFIYLTKSNATVIGYYPVESKDKNFVMPIAENTLASNEATGKTMTRIILGIPMSPIGKVITPKLNGGKDFFIYKDVVYTAVEMESMYQTAKNTTSPTPEQSNLLNEFQKMSVYAVKTGANENTSGITYPIRCGYDSPSLKYFENGMVYYLVPPRHYSDNLVSDREKPGRFGIVRNTLYLYNIQSLSKIGSATPFALIDDREFNYNSTSKLSLGITLKNMSILETDLTL